MVTVIFCNPHLDMQDTFIMRTRFIPSFAIWAIFMGLGLLQVFEWLSPPAKRLVKVFDPRQPAAR